MPKIRMETRVETPLQRCFDLARNIGLHLEAARDSGEKVIAGKTSGLLALDDEVTFEAKHFGIKWRMTSKITRFEPPHRFDDRMLEGPFGAWNHTHRFVEDDGATLMIEEVDFRSPFGPVGALVDRIFLGGYMTRFLEHWAGQLKAAAENGNRV